jgi:hypothetical protein
MDCPVAILNGILSWKIVQVQVWKHPVINNSDLKGYDRNFRLKTA